MPLNEVREILDTIRAVCAVEPITVETTIAVWRYSNAQIFALRLLLVATALISGR